MANGAASGGGEAPWERPPPRFQWLGVAAGPPGSAPGREGDHGRVGAPTGGGVAAVAAAAHRPSRSGRAPNHRHCIGWGLIPAAHHRPRLSAGDPRAVRAGRHRTAAHVGWCGQRPVHGHRGACLDESQTIQCVRDHIQGSPEKVARFCTAPFGVGTVLFRRDVLPSTVMWQMTRELATSGLQSTKRPVLTGTEKCEGGGRAEEADRGCDWEDGFVGGGRRGGSGGTRWGCGGRRARMVLDQNSWRQKGSTRGPAGKGGAGKWRDADGGGWTHGACIWASQ